MTTILGILNITDDSFFDGGKYLEPAAAIAQARALAADGADVLDIGAASSNPDSKGVSPDVEIARLQAVLPALAGLTLSIDTFSLPVQRWALAQGVAYLNDIEGFADPTLYPALAASPAKLIVMHSVQQRGAATRIDVPPGAIMDQLFRFFDARLAALEAAGIARARLILDPGMGFFLGTNPETSFTVLRRLGELKSRYRSWSRCRASRSCAASPAAAPPIAARSAWRRNSLPFVRGRTISAATRRGRSGTPSCWTGRWGRESRHKH